MGLCIVLSNPDGANNNHLLAELAHSVNDLNGAALPRDSDRSRLAPGIVGVYIRVAEGYRTWYDGSVL